MDEQEIYTITIVRNIGIPISFTIKRWKVLFLIAIIVLFTLLLTIGSIDYLFLRLESEKLTKNLAESREKAVLLSDQIARLDHDRYWINAVEKSKEINVVRQEIVEQPEYSTEGIWITNKPTLTEEEYQEGRFVEVDVFEASVEGDVLKLSVKTLNTSNPPQVVGGYICITLMNTDQSPPLYKSVTEAEVGDNGFPASYSSGKPYYIKRQTSTNSLRFTLTDVNEYYTDAMVFLFSYKGRLLNKKQFALNKEIFLE
ncbi:hypothetical protein KJ966_16030 [bacterium]|nr:hypothetical protein [bacterium]